MENQHVLAGRRPSKVEETSVLLDTMVRALKPHDRLPGVRELSNRFEVSIVTLRKAVTVLETRHAIYQRQGSGIYVSPRRDQRHIAMITDYSQVGSPTHSPVWDMTAQTARERATAQQETFQFFTTSILSRPDEPIPQSLLQQIREGRIHGILGAAAHEVTCRWLMEQPIPFVSWGGSAHGVVDIDYEKLVRRSVRTLHERGCGRLALWQSALVNFPDSSDIVALRQKHQNAFEDELRKLRLPFSPAFTRDGSALLCNALETTSQTPQEQGYYAVQEIFAAKSGKARSSTRSAPVQPDGIIIIDDMMTQGAMTAFSNLNIKVGQKVQVASYANKGSAALLGHEDKLILLQIDPQEIIDTMFNMLETLMEGKKLAQREVLIAPRLAAAAAPSVKQTRPTKA